MLSMSLLLCVGPLQAQSWDEVVNDRNTYLYGEGTGSNIEEAKRNALTDLTGKISTVVASWFIQIDDEKTKNGDLDASSYVNMKVSTYSQATLTNTEHFEKEEGDEWLSHRFIKQSELNKIFKGRLLKVKELVHHGENAEKEYKVGDALKYYYWAFTLLKTLPHSDTVTFTNANGAKCELTTYLPLQMDAIFIDISAGVVNHDDDIAELFFTFRNHPVVNMDYT